MWGGGGGRQRHRADMGGGRGGRGGVDSTGAPPPNLPICGLVKPKLTHAGADAASACRPMGNTIELHFVIGTITPTSRTAVSPHPSPWRVPSARPRLPLPLPFLHPNPTDLRRWAAAVGKPAHKAQGAGPLRTRRPPVQAGVQESSITASCLQKGTAVANAELIINKRALPKYK